jgi:hypothetical protein
MIDSETRVGFGLVVVGDEVAVPGAGELVVAYTGGQRE